MVADVAFMEKIYEQAVTHIYRKKYHKSFRRLSVEFRENLVCFKSI